MSSSLQPIRRAVIDVGTNSVKLLVADVADHAIQPVSEQSKQTRLGHGFYETHRLQAEAIAATARAVADYVAAAHELQAASIRIFATSAAREAVNREELTTTIEQASGLKVDVISGEQEAEWGFQGVTTDPQLAQTPLLVMDVGGGSTQFVFGRDGRALFSHSFPLGTVRLMETLTCSDPPQPAELAACRRWLKEFVNREVQPAILGGRTRSPRHAADEPPQQVRRSEPCLHDAQLVGVGGSASILGCLEAELTTFNRERLEATRLTIERVTWHMERLWSLPLEQRKTIVGLPKNRADVILMGVAVYCSVMEAFGFRELRLSTRGLRFAALIQPLPEPLRPTHLPAT